MNKIIFLLIIIVIGCEKEYSSNIGESCSESIECILPMDYAVQSNCPFGAACIDSSCRVVCPLAYHDFNEEISRSYYYMCESDIECNCSERGTRTMECRCADGMCVSVEG